MHTIEANYRGFTLIELLVVIGVIGILAGVIFAAINVARNRSRIAAAQETMHQILVGVESARLNTNEVLGKITGNWWSMGPCIQAGDLRNISDTSTCYTNMRNAISKVNTAAKGVLSSYLTNIRDPWGSPYMWDENELEGNSTACRAEYIISYAADGVRSSDDIYLSIPYFVLTNC